MARTRRIPPARISRRAILGAGLALAAGRFAPARAQSGLLRAYVGTFTAADGARVPDYFGGPGPRSRGIYTFTFDPATGRAGPLALAAEVRNPFNLTLHPGGRVVYTCHWPTERDGQNLISAFAADGDRLRELNVVRSGGGGPTVGVVDRSGRNLLTTNFTTDSIVCYRLAPDGSLGERSAMIGREPAGASRRPQPAADGAPRGPHHVQLSPTQRYAVVPEIWGSRCRVLRFDAASGALATHRLVADAGDAGPRHLVWHPGGQYLYTCGEEGSSISAWRWNEAGGKLTLLQNLTTRPAGFTAANRPADIAMHPGGRLVYVTNRGAGTLAGFRIDPASGRLTAVDQAALGSPSSWSMVFDPSGRWALASAQMGDRIVIYAVDEAAGRLTQTGQTLDVVSPTCLRWA